MPSSRNRDASDLHAITIDAAGTVVQLVDPVGRLRTGLSGVGETHSAEAVRAAFRAEVEYYVPRSSLGRDQSSLRQLQIDAVGVFLQALDARIRPEAFVEKFLAAIEFEPVPNAVNVLKTLRKAEFALACIANWDITLEHHLTHAGVHGYFDVIVSSAQTGAPKPAPESFLHALEELAVSPEAALHIGDDEVDRLGARAAGMAFEPTPLATLPARLGLE